jgi:hypothetical protein
MLESSGTAPLLRNPPGTYSVGVAKSDLSTEYPAGWTCELVVLRLQRYRASTLPLGEALAVAEHLEACLVCLQQLVLIVPPGRRA